MHFRVDQDADGNPEISHTKPRFIKPLNVLGQLEEDERSCKPARSALKSALKSSGQGGTSGGERSTEKLRVPDYESTISNFPRVDLLGSDCYPVAKLAQRHVANPDPRPTILNSQLTTPKSALKNRSCEGVPTRSELTPTPPETPSAASSRKSALKPAAPPSTGIDPVPEKSLVVKSALKKLPPTNSNDVMAFPSGNVGDVDDLSGKGRPRKETSSAKRVSTDLVPSTLPQQSVLRRPSFTRLSINVPGDDTIWSTKGLLKHAYAVAGQKFLWKATLMHRRRSTRLTDLPQLSVEPELSETKSPGGVINPLKELLTSKKPDIKELQKVLISMPDVDAWINASLDSTPPAMPTPIFQAVAAVNLEVVCILVEFKADTLTQYQGTSMIMGWIKPKTDLLACVRNRKSRFVGTMLGDKLEAVEGVIVDARAEAAERSQTLVSLEARRKPTSLIVEKRLSSSSGTEPKRTSMPGIAGFLMHTQGHPNMKYELQGEFCHSRPSSIRPATEIDTGAQRAIKAGSKSLDAVGKDPEAELWQEIGILRKLDHPNIIKLVETFEDESHIFFVFELCNGGIFFDSLAAQGALQVSTCAHLGAQMGAAIRHLHGLSIAHRDIQPESFLLVDDRPLESAVLKLVDFQTAKEFNRAGLMSKVCTLHYVAPEVVCSAEGYDEKADLWSLGVMIFVMCAGTLPFDAESELDVLKAIQVGRYSLPREVTREDVKDILQKLIVVDPGARMDSFAAMEHEFMTSAERSASSNGNSKEHFTKQRRLSTALVKMAESLDDAGLRALRSLLHDLDEGKTGMVAFAKARDGLIQLLESAGAKAEDLANMRNLDVGDDVMLNYSMTIATMMDRRRRLRRDAARAIFNGIDIDKNGNLSAYEIAQAMRKGDQIAQFRKDGNKDLMLIIDEMEEVFGKAHLSKDGNEMTFDEFFKELPKAGLDIVMQVQN